MKVTRISKNPFTTIFNNLGKVSNLCRIWDMVIKYMGDTVKSIGFVKKCEKQDLDFMKDIFSDLKEDIGKFKDMKKSAFWYNLVNVYNKSFYKRFSKNIKSCIKYDKFKSWANDSFNFKDANKSITEFIKNMDIENISKDKEHPCILTYERIKEIIDIVETEGLIIESPEKSKESTFGIIIDEVYFPYASGLYTLIITTIGFGENNKKFVGEALMIIDMLNFKKREIPDEVKEIIERNEGIYEGIGREVKGGSKATWLPFLIILTIVVILGVTGAVIYVVGFIIALILTLWDPEIRKIKRPIKKITGILRRALDSWYYIIMFIVYYRYSRKLE